MLEIEEIKTEVACRNLVFVGPNGNREAVKLRVGLPYEMEVDTWCCPYEFLSESHSKRFGMVGIDSLQALELTMKTLAAEISHWERTRSGTFYFLDEEGAGI